jgi:ABC-type transporter lipoprotein component MlaA
MTLRRALLVLVSFTLGLAGCATVPKDPVARAEFKAHHDPLEPLNRQTFALNLFLDRHLIKPLAKGAGAEEHCFVGAPE